MEPLAKLPPELAPLWQAIHGRLSSGRPVSRVRIGPLDARQQAALADLLGLPRLPGERPSVSLAALDQVLIESVGTPAREVVAALIGPLGDRAGDRERAAAGRDQLWAWLAGHPVVRAQPALAPWGQQRPARARCRNRSAAASHQFVVKVDRANGAGWQLLTRKLHGALSGGEKAIALHLPLFAAVAAHYQATAPRIILLDEVFVGVDASNRGQVFALLSALDLDLVLTSDLEWCTYAELSGIGIHQLITGSDGDDAVSTARFTWDGTGLIANEDG